MLLALPAATRRFADSWDATSEEVAARLPGDDLFPARREISTMAITIDAPPQTVYATSERGTRLVLRMRADGTETGFARWMWNGPLNFGGALFSRKTMVGIKRTAEHIGVPSAL